MDFLSFGYYIVEPIQTTTWLHLNCPQVVTITECICNVHPLLRGTFWLNCEKQQSEYKESLGLSAEEFASLKEATVYLYDNRRLDVDARFRELEDAVLIYNKYLYNLPRLKVVSIALDKTYRDIFFTEAEGRLNAPVLNRPKADGHFIGYDILGWDYSYFHSYLCNSLHEDISEKYPLEINEYGLIQNSYSQVEEFARYIDGLGEPVIWLPFAVYEHTIK